MAEETLQKWEGKVSAEIKECTVEQIWPLLEDIFCNIDKYFPDVHRCYRLEGSPGKPGLVRHIEAKLGWVNEKLLAIDPTNHSLTYEFLENTFGLTKYVATQKVLPIEDGQPAVGCKIEWSFVADPSEGWRFEDLVSYLDNSLHYMVKKMEDAIKAQI